VDGDRKAPQLRVVVSHPFRKVRGMDGAPDGDRGSASQPVLVEFAFQSCSGGDLESAVGICACRSGDGGGGGLFFGVDFAAYFGGGFCEDAVVDGE
jgi:hypothetical protein